MKKMTILGTTLAATLLVALSGCGPKEEITGNIEEGSIEATTTETLDNGEEVDIAEGTLKEDGSFKEVIHDGNDPKVKFEATYKTDWTETWEDVKFDIDQAKIVEVDKYTDNDGNEFKGLMALHYTLENQGTEEVKVRPSEATLILEDGTEIEGEHLADYWEDIFEKDKKRDGHVHFKFTELSQIDQAKEIKLTFDGHKKGDEEDKVSHTFDVSLPLELQK